jgi:GR25 family glycosyltransferase involved in LPS biosynthesis
MTSLVVLLMVTGLISTTAAAVALVTSSLPPPPPFSSDPSPPPPGDIVESFAATESSPPLSVRAYCINLPIRIDRAIRTRMEAAKAGLGSVEMYAAVDCTAVQREHKKYMGLISTGRIGCWLSHQGVWQHIHDYRDPDSEGHVYDLVLEDDVVFEKGAKRMLEQVLLDLYTLGGKWDICLLGWQEVEPESSRVIPGCHVLRRLKVPFYGTYAYIVRRKAIPRLLAITQFDRFEDASPKAWGMIAIDTVLSVHNLNNRIRVVTPSKPLVVASMCESSTAS